MFLNHLAQFLTLKKLKQTNTYLTANRPTTATPLDMRDRPGLKRTKEKNRISFIAIQTKSDLCNHYNCSWAEACGELLLVSSQRNHIEQLKTKKWFPTTNKTQQTWTVGMLFSCCTYWFYYLHSILTHSHGILTSNTVSTDWRFALKTDQCQTCSHRALPGQP